MSNVESSVIELKIKELGFKIYKSKKPWTESGNNLYVLEECPFNPKHRRAAWIIEYRNGSIWANCRHDSCVEKPWEIFLRSIDLEWFEPKNRTEVKL